MLRPHVHTRGSVSSSDMPGMEQSRECGAHASACTEVPAGPGHAYWTVSLVPHVRPLTSARVQQVQGHVLVDILSGRMLLPQESGASDYLLQQLDAAPHRRDEEHVRIFADLLGRLSVLARRQRGYLVALSRLATRISLKQDESVR